ncbi:MAG TPA: hypothetical protein VNA25_26630 [Phycisphaerae bacterium]|nr:hypothetical protein [Phycisphaerae bacterium]
MRRFKWPLQRLLDITANREEALRRELFELSRRIAAVRREILRRRAVLRHLLSELAVQQIHRRIADQEVFMRCAEPEERLIGQFNEQLGAAERQRADKTAELMKTRSSRKTLERLREEARQNHMREQFKLEQKQFDETAHLTFARDASAARRRDDQ